MSWKNYNFPDISGTDLQTALEGLMLAVHERHTAVGSTSSRYMFDEFYNGVTLQPIWEIYYNSPKPIPWVIQNIEDCLEDLYYPGIGLRYLLPDKTPFNLQTAADYLGEELIEPVRGYLVAPADRKYFYVNYEWLMQRYRMLNLLYLFESYPTMIGIKGEYDGYGDTKAEALKDYKGFVEDINSSVLRCIDYIGWSDNFGESVSLSREFIIPKQIRYDAAIPARISQTVTPYGTKSEESTDESFRKSVYFDFGTGLKDQDELKENEEQNLFDFEVQDAKKGDFIDIKSELLDNLRKNITDMKFPDIKSGYRNGSIQRSMYSDYVPVIYDLRPGLKFYNDIG
jgi:hypothetical protein